MRTISSILIAAAVLLGSAGLASAQDRDLPSNVQVTEHTFDDPDQVTGDTVGPWVDILAGRRRFHTGNLIQLRAHFRPELLKTVENL